MNTSADVESSHPEGNHGAYYRQFGTRTISEYFSPNVREEFVVEVSTYDKERDGAANGGEDECRTHFLLSNEKKFWENKINALSLGMHSLLVSIYIYYVVSVLSSGKVQNIRNMQKY